jgi:hypothetical protein
VDVSSVRPMLCVRAGRRAAQWDELKGDVNGVGSRLVGPGAGAGAGWPWPAPAAVDRALARWRSSRGRGPTADYERETIPIYQDLSVCPDPWLLRSDRLHRFSRLGLGRRGRA